MKRRTLALLERLEQRTLDLLVRELAGANERQAVAKARLAAHREMRPGEVDTGWASAGGAAVTARFWRGSRETERQLRDEAVRLDREQALLLDRVTSARTEARRYARLRESLEVARRIETGRAEQVLLDEAALLRAARSG